MAYLYFKKNINTINTINTLKHTKTSTICYHQGMKATHEQYLFKFFKNRGSRNLIYSIDKKKRIQSHTAQINRAEATFAKNKSRLTRRTAGF
jgi:uncharacterized protein (DUF488 family)